VAALPCIGERVPHGTSAFRREKEGLLRLIKYIGSKRSLLPVILNAVRKFPQGKTVIDLFSGTSRVGHHLKESGYRVLSNDSNRYAHVLATCYVQADRESVQSDAETLIEEFNGVAGKAGYFTETFCIKSRFFQPQNGERIDAIREALVEKALPPELEAVLLVSLMEAADRVDSTTGLQMAYLKQWARRSYQPLTLRMPKVLPQSSYGKSYAYCMNALEAAKTLEGDIAYLDPPYNQHSYLANYHIWESLIRWDKPAVYGIACKRTDVRERPSVFNSRRTFRASLEALIASVQAPILMLSFNNEGYLTRDELELMLQARGQVTVIENDFKRYVGAQIGIYNLRGEKVGKVGPSRNKEYLYVVTKGDEELSSLKSFAANDAVI
jgi:adenine-specific DNA-methyltransferase